MLVVSEITLALMLLAGAGLLIRSFARLNAVDPGFDARRLLVARVSLPGAAYAYPQPGTLPRTQRRRDSHRPAARRRRKSWP